MTERPEDPVVDAWRGLLVAHSRLVPAVEAETERVTNEYARQARIPGFRRGHAGRARSDRSSSDRRHVDRPGSRRGRAGRARAGRAGPCTARRCR